MYTYLGMSNIVITYIALDTHTHTQTHSLSYCLFTSLNLCKYTAVKPALKNIFFFSCLQNLFHTIVMMNIRGQANKIMNLTADFK